MRKALTANKREKLYKAWCADQNVSHVSKACGVSEGTVRKYRKADNWDTRTEKIQAKARVKLDDEQADHAAKQIGIIQNVKNLYLSSLLGTVECKHCGKKTPTPKPKPLYGDIDKLVRLEEFMRGMPDSRPDLGRTLEQMSDDDLVAYWERCSEDVAGELVKIKAMTRSKIVLNALDNVIKLVNGS